LKSAISKLLAICCVATALALNTFAQRSDWPQWRGPDRNGVSNERGLLRQWPKEGPKLLWQADDIGDGYSTPAVVGNRIYVMSNRGLQNEFVQALSAQDGKVIWTSRVGNVGNPDQNPNFPKARSTPSVDGNFVYALGSDGDFACLDSKTGKIVWQKNLRKEFAGQPGEWAYAESPLVDGDVVVVTPGGAEATMVAVNKKTGSLAWKSAIPGGDPAGYASAIVVQGGGRKQYVQLLSGGLVGVDAKTGEFLWRYKDVAKGPAQYFTPVARNEFVYTGALGIGGGMVRLKADGKGVAAEQVYFARGLPNGIGGAVLTNDHIFGTEVGRSLLAVEFATGKVKWKQNDFGYASLVAADGLLFCHLASGEMALLDATADGFKETGRFTPPTQPQHKKDPQFSEMAFAFPVIANGKLYLRDLGTLWVYDLKK
jgi:outer membrane protein assembly factor BamB